MKLNIRHSCFETNSSSVHSLSFCTDHEWQLFYNGHTFCKGYDSGLEFLTLEQVFDKLCEGKHAYTREEIERIHREEPDDFNDIIRDNDISNWDTFGTNYEVFYQSYTTPGGEKIYAFGYYGDDF